MSVKRYENNPILSSADLSYPSSLVFNAGVAKYRNQYVMVFRNDVGFAPDSRKDIHINLGIAFSDDGKQWKPAPHPWLETAGRHPELERIYDPRLTVIEDRCYICFAADTRFGVCGGIGLISEDFSSIEILSISSPDNRNMVLFPEKINGKFVRLERPFPEYSLNYREHFDIWMSTSPDGRHWGVAHCAFPCGCAVLQQQDRSRGTSRQNGTRISDTVPRRLEGHRQRSFLLGSRLRNTLEQNLLRGAHAPQSGRSLKSDGALPETVTGSRRKI